MARGKDSPSKFELGGVALSSEADLVRLVADMPAAKLVEIWNSLPGVTPVKKFTDRKIAIRRLWAAVQAQSAAAPAEASKRESTTTPATKAAQVVALLRRPAGATLGELMAATSWQAHSIRGFISGQLAKKQRLKIRSFKRDGARVYKLR